MAKTVVICDIHQEQVVEINPNSKVGDYSLEELAEINPNLTNHLEVCPLCAEGKPHNECSSLSVYTV